MRRTGYIFTILSIIGMALLMQFSLGGCKKEDMPRPADTTFVRLQADQEFHSSIMNGNLGYAVLLPANYNSTTDSFPVVYLLHGYGDNNTAWYSGGRIQYYSDKYSSSHVPMIYVMPQGFNSYYVNRYTGNYRYMDMFTKELVPLIDSLYRTKADKSQRAVMGYSMGGYGALILPAMNPGIFSVSVPLSMSFRTDEQYIAEPDWVFDSQWASVFGGAGSEGNSRLTDYFKEYSPFYFFKQGDLSRFDHLKIFLDCGDDEEALSFTNNALHCLMRDHSINHEYRVRNGAHSWDYWHSALPEALSFISDAFQGIEYPQAPGIIQDGASVPVSQLAVFSIPGTELQAEVLFPPDYDSINGNYPVIYMLCDFKSPDKEINKARLLALLYNSMVSSTLSKSLVVEIPCNSTEITGEKMKDISGFADDHFRTRKEARARVLAGNGEGGALAAELVLEDTVSYSSCFIYNANLETGTHTGGGTIFYYLDESDESLAYQAYSDLYDDIRAKGKTYENRVRQGDDSFESFLAGLSESLPILKNKLTYLN